MGDPPIMQMEAYWSLRDEVVSYEQALLRVLDFETEPTPAYTHLTELSLALGCGPAESDIVSLAWSLLNDSFCSVVCALRPAPRLATACLLLAVELGRRAHRLRPAALRIAGQLDAIQKDPRLEAYVGLSRGVGGEEIQDICRELLSAYEADRLQHAPVESPRRVES